MNKVVINEERCKGCGLCVNACPKAVLIIAKNRLNTKGYHPAFAEAVENCISCAMCATMCPDVAIKVEK